MESYEEKNTETESEREIKIERLRRTALYWLQTVQKKLAEIKFNVRDKADASAPHELSVKFNLLDESERHLQGIVDSLEGAEVAALTEEDFEDIHFYLYDFIGKHPRLADLRPAPESVN